MVDKVVITVEDVGSAADVLGPVPVESAYTEDLKAADNIVNKMAFETAFIRARAEATDGQVVLDITKEDVEACTKVVGRLTERPVAYLERWDKEMKAFWDQLPKTEEG